jgi:type IV pilus assembly protein PilV
MHCARTTSTGLTLTETLTALAMVAIGVLCIATVYLERTQAAPAVLLHSKAGRLAAEMAEHVRNRKDATLQFENPVGITCDARFENADPQRQVSNAIACWQDKVAKTLPNGSGAVGHDSTTNPQSYLITVSWSQPGGKASSYVLRIDVPSAQVATR